MAATDNAQALLRKALAVGDRDSRNRWDIVTELHKQTDRPTFEAARALARSEDVEERILGLDVLGQIGYSANRPFVEDTLSVVIDACEDPRGEVVESAVCALGHISDARGRDAVLRHASHPSADVRFAVAIALPNVAGEPISDDVVRALIELSRDPESVVRDWASMGLGSQLDVDTPAVRQALFERLDDDEGDTAGEALLGLARRHDPRTISHLLMLLDDEPGNLIVEAAAALGAPEALPVLQRLKDAGWDADDPRGSVLDDALAACGRQQAAT